jgi:formylglycine-generating enzyme required for sulfatase activity
VYYTDVACTTVLRTSTNDAGTATAADTAVIKAGANGYRLPTEAQWECAARGGDPTDTTNWGYTYAGGNTVDDVAWHRDNSAVSGTRVAHEVGTKTANLLGLYDMSGNIREWCWDWNNSITTGEVPDPAGPPTGSAKYLRGGSYGDVSADTADLSYRTATYPPTTTLRAGFRVARAGNE